jgi:hypothetical protein
VAFDAGPKKDMRIYFMLFSSPTDVLNSGVLTGGMQVV